LLLVVQDGRNIVLMPYTAALVPVYHSWMQDPAMLALTESEPLTLEEEYANQVSWNVDPTKYCFIIHSRRPVIRTFQEGPGIKTPFGTDYTLQSEAEAEALKQPVDVKWVEGKEGEAEDEASETGVDAAAASSASPSAAPDSASAAAASAASSSPASAAGFTSPAAASASSSGPSSGEPYPLTPIGDVNLFLYPDFNLEDYGIAGGGCEIEIMIAEESYRRRGLGLEALRLLMEFSAAQLGVERFVVKVLASNTASIELFEKKLGFRVVEYVECFDEVVMFKDTSIEEPPPAAEESNEGEQEDEESTVASLSAPMSRLHTDDTVTRDEESSRTATTATRTIQDLD
jgi:ribosomal protein S18 acetylase RimI-like enzyme